MAEEDTTGSALAGERDGRPRGPLDTLLNIFTDVRGGEGLTALLLFLDVFLLLLAYYLLKTIREPLVLGVVGGGAEVKTYLSAAIAVLLLGLVPLYGGIASRVSRVRLINGVTLFFIACLIGFFVWARAVGVPGTIPGGGDKAAAAAAAAAAPTSQLALGAAFFVWVGIFNLMIIAQFWAFANDLYTVEQGKRLFALVALGASLGAIAGAAAAAKLVIAFGLYPLMGLAAALLAVCMVLTNVVHVRERRHAKARADAGKSSDADAPIKGHGGFRLVFSDRYLTLIALMVLLLNLVNTTGEYILGKTLTNIAKDMVAHGKLADADIGKWIGAFTGGYFTWVNIVSAVLQAFVVSRVIKWLGVGRALLVMPLVSLGGYATLAFLPLLSLIRTAKIAENSLDYSLNNTARQSLFLPLSREAKYKAKQAIDTFFQRFGDVASAGVVFAGTTWFAFSPRNFAVVNALLVLVWLGIAFALGRAFRARTGESATRELRKVS